MPLPSIEQDLKVGAGQVAEKASYRKPSSIDTEGGGQLGRREGGREERQSPVTLSLCQASKISPIVQLSLSYQILPRFGVQYSKGTTGTEQGILVLARRLLELVQSHSPVKGTTRIYVRVLCGLVSSDFT